MATWLRPPLKDRDKHWEPEWGLHLLLDSDDPRDKTQPIFGAPDEIIEQKLPPDLLEDLFGKNREIFGICVNGTTAVTVVPHPRRTSELSQWDPTPTPTLSRRK